MTASKAPTELVAAIRKAICGCSYPCDSDQPECRCLTRQRAEADAAVAAIEARYPGCWEALEKLTEPGAFVTSIRRVEPQPFSFEDDPE